MQVRRSQLTREAGPTVHQAMHQVVVAVDDVHRQIAVPPEWPKSDP